MSSGEHGTWDEIPDAIDYLTRFETVGKDLGTVGSGRDSDFSNSESAEGGSGSSEVLHMYV